ncbi:DNA polymerase III subunit delta' [Parvularcula dongshanensis]|uniref:DNA polymerase-3 subunit delta n=1 Tax=Parvularcula dongshanensis TaxID=1173995 RepID=A0A840I392_9PROT|nr:DNA polymerase III subunit delta' [Parvularcula dongshanensis]MBB4659476.1 DNA polymerase-3 subunit delta' [Parvularcula dongshanensis]
MSSDLLLGPRAWERLDAALASGALTGGWLLTGPEGIGKGTLADALAAAHLSNANSLGRADERTAGLVAARGHPDLVVLRRTENEKTGRMRPEILVDEVRAATSRLHTTSATGRRAVIVDMADDLGRSGANALLKSLEEPPAGTAFLLLSRAPGKLLPTIRSRCRVAALNPLEEGVLVPWLRRRTDADGEAAAEAARLSGGAPGRALSLLEGEGEAARALADRLLRVAAGQGDVLALAEAAGARANDAVWPEAWAIVQNRLSAALRGQSDPIVSKSVGPPLLQALDEAKRLAEKAGALNADRAHTALVLTRTLARGMNAGR